jgi:hypothetical protein
LEELDKDIDKSILQVIIDHFKTEALMFGEIVIDDGIKLEKLAVRKTDGSLKFFELMSPIQNQLAVEKQLIPLFHLYWKYADDSSYKGSDFSEKINSIMNDLADYFCDTTVKIICQVHDKIRKAPDKIHKIADGNRKVPDKMYKHKQRKNKLSQRK